MTITFYGTALCPRCYLAKKALEKIAAEDADLQIETIEIATHALDGWRKGIRMIPALKIDDDLLSGILLDEQRIRSFIDRHRPGA
nr:glutaredoxin family protein [uncultured Desulfuromonas sp.]